MPRRPLFALALAAALSGCGTQTLVAGLFINTPAVPNPAQPGTKLGPFSALLGFIVSVDTSNPTNLSSASIKGVTGVDASLVFESCVGLSTQPASDGGVSPQKACVASGQGGTDRVIAVGDSGSGLYELNSSDHPELTFEQGVTYTMILQEPGGDAFGARFQPGPAPIMHEFVDKTAIKTLTQGASLAVTRDDLPGPDGRLLPAAIVVASVDPRQPNAMPKIVWSSIKYTDPKTLALLALSDAPYRVSSFTIDGSAFVAKGYYLVTMVSLAEGKASGNAFIGSTALAGTGDSGIVQVK